MSDKATITAQLDGAGQVVAGAKQVGNALQDAKKAGEGAKQGAGGVAAELRKLSAAGEDLKTALSPKVLFGALIGGFAASAVLGVVNYIREGRQAALDFEAAVAPLGRRTGTSFAALRTQIEGVERATHQGTTEQIAFRDALAQLTYGGEGAAASLQGMAGAATGGGRALSEYVPVAAALQELFGTAKNLTGELDRLNATATRFSTIAGPKAFQDTLAALRPVLATLGPMSDDAAHRLEGLTAQVGARYKPETARRVTGQLVGALQANAPAIERSLGVKIRDENGQISDPEAALKKVQTYVRKRSGSKAEMQRRLEGAGFGSEGSAFLVNNDFETGERQVKEVDDKAAAAERLKAFQEYLASPQGRRKDAEIKAEQRQRHAGERALKFTDNFTGAGLGAAGAGLADAGAAGVRAVSELAHEVGAGVSSAAKGAEGTGAAITSGLGSAAKGAEGTWAAIGKGLADAMRGAGIGQVDERKLAAAMADELRRAPLQVRPAPPNPNEPRGN